MNLSRLQLALRGLERGDTVVRIAVLGIGGDDGIRRARRLVRLLLADPLIEGTWETRLGETGEAEEEGKALLIRLVFIARTWTPIIGDGKTMSVLIRL